MRPGVWSYVLGSVGLAAFVATGGLYVQAAYMVPVWGLFLLAATWVVLLMFAIWLMRMSPGWVLAVPVLSVIALAAATGIVEITVLLTA